MKPICDLQGERVNIGPLHSPRRRRLALVAALALSWPLLAAADCVDTRKAAASEIEFHGRAMAALVAALPPTPKESKLQNKDNVTSLGQLCAGKTGDFSLEATRFYEHNYRKSIVSVAMNVRRLPAAVDALSAAYGTASPNASAGLKVNNVVWSVSGSDSPLRQALADAIDRAHLQALVGKPLPSEAESAAYAAKAVPANVANVSARASPAPQQATSQSASPTQSAAAQPSNASAPAAPEPAGEPLKKAAEAVNLLRGMFGR